MLRSLADQCLVEITGERVRTVLSPPRAAHHLCDSLR
jgi:hypothetical protein